MLGIPDVYQNMIVNIFISY